MKLVFAHDHVFYKYKNQFFSTGGLSKETLKRYTYIFDEVIVISRQKRLEKPESNLTLASTPGVEFVKVPNFKKLSKVFDRIKARKTIHNVIKDSDAVISRLPSSIGSMAVSISKKQRKPYLIELVACPWDALWNHSIKGRLIAPYAFFETKKHVKRSDYVLYVTNKFLQKRYPTKGKNINCSNVELTELDNDVLNRRLDKICRMKENNKIIIGTTAAVNVRHKGQQYVIKAMGELKKQGYTNFDYHLVGAGDQSYLKSIAKKYNVAGQVKFLGPMQHSEVFEWLDTIDIYTQPSRQEGLPRALIEAMSRGLPAFGANTAGIPELLEKELIVSNTRDNFREICSILLNFNKKKMKVQAKVNFMESKKYESDIIENRRYRFFKKFISNI